MTEVKTMKPSKGQSSQLYSQATAWLRETHREAFEQYLAELYLASGMVYQKRKTAEEREAAKHEAELAKARQRMAELQQKYPELQEADEPPVEITSTQTPQGRPQ